MPKTAGLPVTEEENIAVAREFCLQAQKNHVIGMQDFLHEHPGFNINTPFKDGFKALHYACKAKALEAALFLINLGADPKQAAFNKNGTTPLDLCKADPTFSEAISKKINPWTLGFNINDERNNRVQLGDLCYQAEIEIKDTFFSVQRDDSKTDSVMHMLYSITGRKFKLFMRMLGDKDIFDAIFDSDSSGLTYAALTLAGLPSEYVNSKFLVVTDIYEPENIAKLESFYAEPLNRYSEDEIFCDNWKREEKKHTNRIPLIFPEKIVKKYFSYNPPGTADHAYSEKTDPESRRFFESKKYKTDRVFKGSLTVQYEICAKMARTSLSGNFGASRPNVVHQGL